jgi:hypothetical protein
LVSPAVTIPVNGQVRFYSKQAQPADFNGEYTIRISTTSQTDPTTFTTVQTYDEATVGPIVSGAPAWEQKFVLLPTYVGQTVYIAFVKKNGSFSYTSSNFCDVVMDKSKSCGTLGY